MALGSQLLRYSARLQAAASNSPWMKKGESGDAVALVQKALIQLGYAFPVSTAGGSPDGIFGKETKAKVAKFQADNDLDDDGIVGGLTLAVLDGLLAHSEDEIVEIVDRFEIMGTPAPEKLPGNVKWAPESYVRAVRYQITQRLQRSAVARAVIAACRWRIKVRPAPDASDPNAFWDPNAGLLRYTPGSFVPGYSLYVTPPNWVGFTPDAVLIHEIVHTMRDASGRYHDDQETLEAIRHPPWTTGISGGKFLVFGTRGEFNAVVIANIYLSERNPGLPLSGLHRQLLLLRKDHHTGYGHMRLAAPETFHQTPTVQRLLRNLWRDQPVMCASIAAAHAPFNPIRDVSRG